TLAVHDRRNRVAVARPKSVAYRRERQREVVRNRPHVENVRSSSHHFSLPFAPICDGLWPCHRDAISPIVHGAHCSISRFSSYRGSSLNGAAKSWSSCEMWMLSCAQWQGVSVSTSLSSANGLHCVNRSLFLLQRQ